MKNQNTVLKQKLHERDEKIVEQNCNHWQKIQENRLVSSQLCEQQKENCTNKIEMIEQRYHSKIEEVKNDCSQIIAVIESQCAETLESTTIECAKLATLFVNALETEKKRIQR